MIATHIGPYEITAKLGEGGMGEVWRATDTRLKREVALKVLPAAFTADAERLARFEREAQLLAQLHHPNIASIFGLEDADGVRALVMELVDGEDLSARIARGPLPLDEVLSIGKQIAEALEAAHERGIVHRDLKPQNVKVRADGAVKVLDFGLAKAMETSASGSTSGAGGAGAAIASPTMMQSPTLTGLHGTQLGVILGTAAYMAPEQAKGAAVDKRADIWAFGVVLWEMLTGRQLFAGDSVAETLAGVLKSDVDLGAPPAATPRALRSLLRRCLERNPRNRLHDIADARLVLDELLAGKDPEATAAAAVTAAPPRWTRALPWAIALALLLVVIALLARWGASPVDTGPRATRLRVLPTLAGEIEGWPALAPDGRTIAFTVQGGDGVIRLHTMSLATGESQPLAGTEHAEEPFWSPDGRWIAFFAAGHLSRVERSTGLTQPLAAASDPRGGCWDDDGYLYFSPNSSTGIFRVAATGGATERIVAVDPAHGDQSLRLPTCLPGGGALLYTVLGADTGSGIFWRSLHGGATHHLAPETSRTVFDARGYLLWQRGATLVAQRFDPARGALAGDPLPIGRQVAADGQRAGVVWFDAAAGVLAMRTGGGGSKQLRWFDRSGRALADVTSVGFYSEPALSLDGTRVAVTVGNKNNPIGDIWVFDATAKDRGARVTFGGGASSPTWFDGDRALAFAQDEDRMARIKWRAANGAGPTQTLWQNAMPAFLDSASPREPLGVLEVYQAGGGVDLELLPLAGGGRARPLATSDATQAKGMFSPDGRLIAYSSDESGLSQIYVAEIADPSNRRQVTTEGGDLPQWRGDGKELYYVGYDRVLRALPVRSLGPFTVGPPVALFRMRIPALSITGNRSFYCPSPDGQRFLVNAWMGEESDPGFLLTLGWNPQPEGGR